MIDLNERVFNNFGSQEKLNDYLELTSYKHNLNLDNLRFNFNQISQVENRKYSFNYEEFKYTIYRLDFCDKEKNEFYLFSFLLPVHSSFNHKLIASTKTNKILVLPFFSNALYYEEFNILICSKTPDDWNFIDNFLYDLYYFDLYGRFIKEEKGILNSIRIPNIAMVNNKIIPIVFNSSLYEAVEIYSYFLIKIFKYNTDGDLYGLIDNNGILYSQDFYHKIIVNKTIDKAILQKETNTYILDIKSRTINSLPYNYLLKHNDNFIKVMSNEKKYGIIDFYGNEIIKPIFNYIDFNFTEDRFKICHTPYEWIKNEQLEDEFKKIEEYIPNAYGLKGHYVEGKLLNSKWGIINSDLDTIIPFIYKWIEEYDENTYLVNEDGNIYKYTSMDLEALEDRDKEIAIHSQIMVVGGKWYKIDKQGENKTRFSVEKGEIQYTTEHLKRLEKLPYDFYKFTDKKAFKI
ncbi:MAG: WG repeat-containing protein [Limnohabitans sp.]|nr:WG repeat-containing protein [Limnohabitans sp.]